MKIYGIRRTPKQKRQLKSVKKEIKKLSRIVDWVYETEPTGAEMLSGEETFGRIFQYINHQKRTNREEREFRYLEYEYELHHVYRFGYADFFVEKILESLRMILFQSDSHQRIKKLTERIFKTGMDAAEDQADVLQQFKHNPHQIAWLWEEYAEQCVTYEKYREALKYYGLALDVYLSVAESKNDYEIIRIFYDGNVLLHISDLIYRMYNKAAVRSRLWEACIQELKKREERLKEYSYSHLYLAMAQYEAALEAGGDREMLRASLNTLEKLPVNDRSEGGYTIECDSLYCLKEYRKVLEVYERVKKYYPDSKDLEECRRMAFFSLLEMLWDNMEERNVQIFEGLLKKAAECFENLPVGMLDGAKTYAPIFEFYCKYKEKPCIEWNLIKLFFYLTVASSALMKELQFYDRSADLGYYTSLTSLFYLLEDKEEDVEGRLSLFDARYMNDPNEGKVLAEYLGRRKHKISTGNNGVPGRWTYDNNITFLKSFTTNVDSLPMWVQYAGDGQGCFVWIDQAMFEKGQKLVESRKDMNINNLQEEESYLLYHVAYFDGKKFCTSNGKDVTAGVEKIQDIYMRIMKMSEDLDGEMKADVENVVDHILNRVQYLIKKNDYVSEQEVRIFFSRVGNESDIKKTSAQEGEMPKIYINLKVPTEIKEIILGPKIGNGYEKVPYIYWKLQKLSETKNVKITQSSIEYV